MTWPSGTLTKVHLDAATDDPSQARAELAAAIDKINLILAEVDAGAVVWHSGNDGASSGLDADTLDSQHAPSGTIVGTSDSQTLTNKTLTSPILNTSVSGTAVKDEDNMASNSATHLCTQQSIKAYVDTSVAAISIDETLGLVPATQGSTTTIAHGGAGTMPVLMTVMLRCVAAGGDAGYSQNDEIPLPQRDDVTSGNLIGMNWYADATNAYVIAGNSAAYDDIVNPSTGAFSTADFTSSPVKWKVVVRAWNQ